MDQFMVDVTDIPGAAFMDRVVLIGKDGKDEITVEELSKLSGRFNYEFVCDLGKRIPREYIQNGQVIEQVDYFDV
jgi:alanine racemase